ncbi:MAG: hypothetical protein KC503_26565 [Myxococcales bacterium]|nr:hypothetical protein [Myxococcales bacterium]
MKNLLAATLLVGVAIAPSPSPAASKRLVVAVFPLKIAPRVPINASARAALDSYFRARLAASRRFAPVPRTRLVRSLRAQKKASYRPCYDTSCQIAIGRELAAAKSIVAEVLLLGDRCVALATVFDLERATAEHAAEARGGCDESALADALRRVARELDRLTPRARANDRDPRRPRAEALRQGRRARIVAAATHRIRRVRPLRGRRDAPRAVSARTVSPSHWRQAARERRWVVTLPTLPPLGAQIFVAGFRGGAAVLSGGVAHRLPLVGSGALAFEPELYAVFGLGAHHPAAEELAADSGDVSEVLVGGGVFGGLALSARLGPFKVGSPLELRALELRAAAGAGWSGWHAARADEHIGGRVTRQHLTLRGALSLRYFIKPDVAVALRGDYQYSFAGAQSLGLALHVLFQPRRGG